MVKHIVLFKLKESLPQEEKLDIMNRFKAAIEALPSKISVIRKIFVGSIVKDNKAWRRKSQRMGSEYPVL